MSIILLIISGLCTALSIQYKALYFLSYIGLIPYYCFLIQSRKVNRKGLSLYGYGLIWSMSFYMTVYTFFFYMYPMSFLDCTKAEAIFIILFCWIALSMLQAVPMALAAPLFKAISGKTAFAPLIFASLITIFEWLQNFTWAGVPFVRLAVSQVSFAPAAQSASLLGSLFLSFFTAAVNGYLGNGILYFAKEKNRSLGLISCVIALASVMINTGYGLIRIAVTEKADSQKEKIKVAAIQGNISSLDKWNSSLLDGILDKYIDMTYEAADNGAQMIVYPESAMNYYIKSGEGIEARTRIRNICKEYGITAVIGAFDCGYNMKKEFVTYNALVTFYPDGSLEEFPYYKRHLVPFGEYVPMERVIATLFPFLADLNMFEEQLTPGDYAAVCDTEYGKLGRMICFDSIYETTALESIRDGAEILIVSTNDSWYLDSPAATIHNSHSQLRAIESGRYLIRAANTGISSVINANGVITEELGATKEGILYGEVSFMQERTLYSYVGDSFMFVTFALIINGIVYKIIKKRKGDI